MPTFFRNRSWLGRTLAGGIAYLFAIQVMLASVVATQMAIADPVTAATLCSSATVDGTHPNDTAPPSHASHLPCAICAWASAAPVLPDPGDIPLAGRSAAVSNIWTALLAPRSEARHEPRMSQGPPLSI